MTWSGSAVLRIPANALFRSGDDWHVFKYSNGVAEKTKIELGHRNDRDAEILGGLEEGDQVVTYPSDQISDGVQLKDRADIRSLSTTD